MEIRDNFRDRQTDRQTDRTNVLILLYHFIKSSNKVMHWKADIVRSSFMRGLFCIVFMQQTEQAMPQAVPVLTVRIMMRGG